MQFNAHVVTGSFNNVLAGEDYNVCFYELINPDKVCTVVESQRHYTLIIVSMQR